MGTKKEHVGMSKDKERFGCSEIKKLLPEWFDFLSEIQTRSGTGNSKLERVMGGGSLNS